MTVNELYRSFLKELSLRYNTHEASNITSMIFEHFAGIDRAALIKNPGMVLEPRIIASINESLVALKQHKPIQYITGEAWFYKMKLKVTPAVLIPRPETEELVDAILHSLKDKTNTEVIDIGTGSGCIAIAIKKNANQAMVTAIDISSAALEIAKENAAGQRTEIRFLRADFLSVKDREELKKYDVIVSNPPYIPENELEKMDKNVTDWEPHTALFVNAKQPLIFYKKIIEFSKDHLNENGMIFLETHEDLAGDVCKLFNDNLYNAVIKKDIFEKERMVIATRCR